MITLENYMCIVRVKMNEAVQNLDVSMWFTELNIYMCLHMAFLVPDEINPYISLVIYTLGKSCH